jgi:N-glycosylase/DNA lyase
LNKTGISSLARKTTEVMSNPEVRAKVKARVAQFDKLRGSGSEDDWFSELCFCLMTANSTARLGIEIQESLGKGCKTFPRKKVEAMLREHGHRFARPRAGFICEARGLPELSRTIESFRNDREAREWLVENVLGLGYKEASHFLRNTGHYGVAILDRHIIRIMADFGLIPEVPKTITPKRYLEMEKVLDGLSEKLDIPPGILDFYLWYMRTGEILK